MTERCAIDLTVLGNTPGWSVDKNDKEFSIPMTARLVVNNAYSEDESDLVPQLVADNGDTSADGNDIVNSDEIVAGGDDLLN